LIPLRKKCDFGASQFCKPQGPDQRDIPIKLLRLIRADGAYQLRRYDGATAAWR
jgi:hypothetical protein